MIKRLSAMVVPLLLLGFAPPRPAVASDLWMTHPCPSGRLHVEAVTIEVAEPQVLRVELPGSLACSAADKYRFAAAIFMPGASTATVYESMLGAYSPVGTTEFVASFGMRKQQQQLGVCLMPDPQTRLSCALISIDALGDVTVSSAEPDSQVVTAELSGFSPLPECNSCWRVL